MTNNKQQQQEIKRAVKRYMINRYGATLKVKHFNKMCKYVKKLAKKSCNALARIETRYMKKGDLMKVKIVDLVLFYKQPKIYSYGC